MSNLDVAVTLTLKNLLSGPAKQAAQDVKAVGAAMKGLEGAKAGTLSAELGRVATTSAKADRAVRNLASGTSALKTSGTTAGSLATELGRVSASGDKAGASVGKLASGISALRGAPASTAGLVRNLDQITSAAARATAALARTKLGSMEIGGRGSGGPSEAKPPGGGPGGSIGSIAKVVAPAALGYGAARSFVDFADVERRLTRIGITAEASRTEMRAVMVEAQNLAQSTGMSFDQVVGGYEALATQGKKMADIRAMMPSIASTAQAAGAEVSDIANSAGAIGDQMGIAATRMQAAFDIMVKGGNEGKFELKDMARYLPSLAPAAASVGLKGEEGLKRLVAMLQIVRNQTGSAEEAASSMNNIFAKMESEETAKRFKKFGIDLRKEMKGARESGRDLLSFFTELSDRALKGDLSKLPQLFQDMEFARGMRALLSQKGAVEAMMATLGKADGSTMEALNRVLDDSRTKVDQLSNSWSTFKTRLGETLSPAAVPVLDALSRGMKAVTDGVEEAKGQTVKPGRMLSDQAQTKVDKYANLLLYGDTMGGESRVVSRARAGVHRTEAAGAKAKIEEEIAREEAEIRQSEAKPFPGLRREIVADARERIAGLKERLVQIDEASRAVDAALAALDTHRAQAKAFATLRIRQGKEGLDPYRDGTMRPPEFGGFPTRDPKRNVSFGLHGPPDVRPVYGPDSAMDGPKNVPLPPERPASLGRTLNRLEDVLNDGSPVEALRRTAAAAETTAGQIKAAMGMDLSGAAAQTMAGYQSAFQAGAAGVLQAAQQLAAQLSSTMSINISPTITPRINSPIGGPTAPSAPVQKSSSRGITVQHASFHGVRDITGMHREISRLADRTARDERDNSLHDIA